MDIDPLELGGVSPIELVKCQMYLSILNLGSGQTICEVQLQRIGVVNHFELDTGQVLELDARIGLVDKNTVI